MNDGNPYMLVKSFFSWIDVSEIRGRFLRTWCTSNLNLIAASIYSFGMVALVVREAGVDELGLWTLIVQFAGYLSLIDAGVTSACIRRFVGPIARKETEGFHSLFQAAFVVALFQAVICWLGLALIPLVACLLKIPSELAPIFVQIMAFQFFFSGIFFINRPFTALLLAAQRFEINNLVSAICSLVSLGIIWGFLRLGWGLWSLVIASLFQQVMGAVTTLLLVTHLKLLPAQWRGIGLPWKKVRILLFDSLHFFSWSGFSTLSAVLQSVFLSRFLGLEAVALWNVGSKIVTLFYTFISSSLNSAFPSLTEVLELGRVDECRKLCRRFLYWSLGGAGGLGLFYILANGLIVQFWTSGKIAFPFSLGLILASWLLLATGVRALACFSNVWHQRAAMLRGPMVEFGFFAVGLSLALLSPSPWTLGFALLLGQIAPLLLIYFPAWRKVLSMTP